MPEAASLLWGAPNVTLAAACLDPRQTEKLRWEHDVYAMLTSAARSMDENIRNPNSPHNRSMLLTSRDNLKTGSTKCIS